MKKNKRILAVLLASAVTSLSAYAQIQLPNDGSTMLMNTPPKVGQGNTYEKEVTPLLRDISKKKSLLELRKLDRELEKLEEETIIAKIEREKVLNPPAPINMNLKPSYGQGLPSLNPAPNPFPISGAGSSSSPSTEEENIRILMVYGFDNNLYAKVSSGTQGGYIVKKGDILPDGRLVLDVTPNFVEVKKSVKSKVEKSQKLYVSGPAPVKAAGASSGSSNGIPSTSPNMPPGPGATFIPPVGSAVPIVGTGAVPLSGNMSSVPNSPVRR